MPLSNSNPILIRKYGDSMTECHLSVMSQQTTTATNRARVMHAVIHAWYMSGLISHSVYIAIVDSGPRGPRYIGALLYIFFFIFPKKQDLTFHGNCQFASDVKTCFLEKLEKFQYVIC